MRPAAVSNTDGEIRSDQTESIAKIYLDPLLEIRSFYWIGIYEKLFEQSKASRLCYRGPVPPCHEFDFGTGNVGTAAESGLRKVVPDVSADSTYSQCFIDVQSEWIEPILFEKETIGVIDVEEDKKDAFSTADQSLIEKLQNQVAPLIAWREATWTARLKALRLLEELKAQYSDFEWVGIYRKDPNKADDLIVSLQVGDPTPHVRIPIAQGICGAAVREEKTINVPDVKADPRFLACSITTKSEIVVPLRNSRGDVVAEVDVDSSAKESFKPEVQAKVEALAQKLEAIQGLFA